MSKSCLGHQRWIEPIESFVKEHGRATPRWAIICTYECDLARLDRQVLPVLSRRGRAFRTVVLADAGAMEARLSVARPPRGQVNIHSVRLSKQGVFHPKIVLLRAGDVARVCFGSANVSDGGMGANLELWAHSDQPETLAAICHFLGELALHPHIEVDPACKRQLERGLLGLASSASRDVWTSLTEAFAARVRSLGEVPRGDVTIVSPAYATDRGAVVARRVFPQPRATVYTDEPARIPHAVTYKYSPPAAADVEATEVPEYPNHLHAKLYLLSDGRKNVAWIGSANFTAQALTKTVASGGNVECLFRSELPDDEAAVLVDELKTIFSRVEKTRPSTVEREEFPHAESSIVGGELALGRQGLRLVIYTVLGATSVVLEHEGHRAKLAIAKQRCIIEGAALRRAFPLLSANGPSVVLMHEIVGGRRIPVLFNIPFVVDSSEGGSSEASLDELLDELRGRIEPVRREDDGEDAIEDEAASDEEEDAIALLEAERCLDDVKHQGELDRVAVKAALLRRLIVARTTPGQLREQLLQQALRLSLAACPPVVRPVLERWFKR